MKQVWVAAAKQHGRDHGAARSHALSRTDRRTPSIRPDGAHYDGAGADRIAPAVMASARAAVAARGRGQSSERTPRRPNHASSATHAAS